MLSLIRTLIPLHVTPTMHGACLLLHRLLTATSLKSTPSDIDLIISMKRNNGMKNLKPTDVIKRLITASLVTLGIYILTVIIVAAIFENLGEYFILASSVLYSAVFSYFCIYYLYERDGSGVNIIFSEYKGKQYSVKKDIPVMFKHEYKTIAAFFTINLFSWLLTRLDLLLFGKRLISLPLIIFAPIQFVGEALPSWCGNILGYIVGALMVSVIYLVMIAFFRKRWSK